jgi:hypothetical protein
MMKLSTTLTKFLIDNTQLDHFPYQITNMRALTILSAMNNQIPSNEREYLRKNFLSNILSLFF